MNKTEKALEWVSRGTWAQDDYTPMLKAVTCEALHEKLNRENPQPLTIEQLKQRIGKPVFVMRNTAGCSPKFGGWRVLSRITLTIEEYGSTICELCWDGGGTHEYENINCYDYEPKDVKKE